MAHLRFPRRRSRPDAGADVPDDDGHPSLAELLEADPDGPVAEHLDECSRCAELLEGASPTPALRLDWPTAPTPAHAVLPEVSGRRATAARFSRGVVSGRRKDWVAYTTVAIVATGTGLAAAVRGVWRLVRRRR